MSNNIEIKTKDLETKKDNLNTSFQKIAELITKQDKLLASLVDESIWKGPTRNAVLDKKNEIRNQTKNIKDTFNNYVVFIQNVVDQYKKLDIQLNADQEKKLNK